MKIAPKTSQRKNLPSLKGPTVPTDARTKATPRAKPEEQRFDRHTDAFESRSRRHTHHARPVSYKGPIIRTGTSRC